MDSENFDDCFLSTGDGRFDLKMKYKKLIKKSIGKESLTFFTLLRLCSDLQSNSEEVVITKYSELLSDDDFADTLELMIILEELVKGGKTYQQLYDVFRRLV